MCRFALITGPEANLAARSAVQLGEVEITIGAVRNHRLTRLQTKLGAIEMDSDNIRFERHQVGDATNLGIGVGIRPCCLTRVTDRVIAAESLVRAECLQFHSRESGCVDVLARNVPAWCETGLVENQRPLGIGDDPVALADHEAAGSLTNVDAVVGVSGVPQNSFVLFIEGVHGAPGERNASLQFACVGGQAGVLPGASLHDVLLVRADAIPGCEPEIGVLGRMLGPFQHIWRHVGLRKVGYRIAAGFEQQEDVLAFGDPTSPEAHAHAPAQSLDVQKPLGRWLGYDELADWSG